MKEAKHPEELFLEAQRALGVVKKDATNPHFKSHYATYPAVVEAVKGPLNDLGLSFRHTSRYADSHYFVGSVIMAPSGVVAAFEMPLMTDTPQKMGSAITYAKRYTLEAVLGLPTEDDDGNATTQTSTQRTPTQAQSPAPSRASQAPQAQGEKKGLPINILSEAQLKRLFAITKANGVEKFDVDAYLLSKWGQHTRNGLTRTQYDEICDLLNSGMFYQKWEDHIIKTHLAPPPVDDAPPYTDDQIPF